MFGISTAWKSANSEDGKQLFKQMLEANIPGIELEYRITVDTFEQMKKDLQKSDITILSIHNFFPHPEILPPSKASGDALLLSSLDKDERKLAIKYAFRSIQYAHDLEARAVVFHLGRVDINREKQNWLQLYDTKMIDKSEGQKFIEKKMRQRQLEKDKNLDAVLFSLEVLNEEALKRNVMLGIENRYYWNEIPNLEEIGLLLEKFDGGNIKYWHDCGHAQTWETFGLTTHEQFLKNYSNKLLGIHLHDCIGYHDHLAPGNGEIDFDMVKKHLQSDSIKIIEVHNEVALSELKDGIEYLQKKEII